jgi:hypothetical protein
VHWVEVIVLRSDYIHVYEVFMFVVIALLMLRGFLHPHPHFEHSPHLAVREPDVRLTLNAVIYALAVVF